MVVATRERLQRVEDELATLFYICEYALERGELLKSGGKKLVTGVNVLTAQSKHGLEEGILNTLMNQKLIRYHVAGDKNISASWLPTNVGLDMYYDHVANSDGEIPALRKAKSKVQESDVEW